MDLRCTCFSDVLCAFCKAQRPTNGKPKDTVAMWCYRCKAHTACYLDQDLEVMICTVCKEAMEC